MNTEEHHHPLLMHEHQREDGGRYLYWHDYLKQSDHIFYSCS
jgi:hypothetical protein